MQLNTLRPLAPIALAAVSLGLFSASAAAQFSGGIGNGSGSFSPPRDFLYDTGNGANTVASHDVATDAGLGTTDAAGNFTPAVGSGAVKQLLNAGAYTVWKFPARDVTADDSTGTACVFRDCIIVATNRANGNSVIASENILSERWINGTKACIAGAGEKAKGYWSPGWTPPAAKKETKTKTDTKTGGTMKVLEAEVSSPNGGTLLIDVLYSSGSEYSFLPQDVVTELEAPAGLAFSNGVFVDVE